MEKRKRKNLSDITHLHNLTPISVLRELVASTQFSKPSTSTFNPNSSSTSDKSCPERSNTSVGSSTHCPTLSPKSDQFRRPPVAVKSVSSRKICEKNKNTAVCPALNPKSGQFRRPQFAGCSISSPAVTVVKSESSRKICEKNKNTAVCPALNPKSGQFRRPQFAGCSITSPAVTVVKSESSRKTCEKNKNSAEVSSCPPITRSKKIQNDLDEAGDVKYSGSWTDPLADRKKKRCLQTEKVSEWPEDFIREQKAYYDDVDNFELPIEEVSEDEID